MKFPHDSNKAKKVGGNVTDLITTVEKKRFSPFGAFCICFFTSNQNTAFYVETEL